MASLLLLQLPVSCACVHHPVKTGMMNRRPTSPLWSLRRRGGLAPRTTTTKTKKITPPTAALFGEKETDNDDAKDAAGSVNTDTAGITRLFPTSDNTTTVKSVAGPPGVTPYPPPPPTTLAEDISKSAGLIKYFTVGLKWWLPIAPLEGYNGVAEAANRLWENTVLLSGLIASLSGRGAQPALISPRRAGAEHRRSLRAPSVEFGSLFISHYKEVFRSQIAGYFGTIFFTSFFHHLP